MVLLRLCFFLPLVCSSLLSEEPLTNMATTSKDREEIGMDRFSSQQKKAFEKWLENWTQTVIIHASSYHPTLTLTQWVEAWKAEQRRKKIMEEEEPDAVIHTIFRNKDGKVLELANGSIWEIVVFDQIAVSMWARGENVTISENQYNLMRPYTIQNITRNEQASAKLKRKASSDGKRPSDPPSYFADSQPIEMIEPRGETIILKNKKEYNITPRDQQRVLKNWKELDRIRVTKSGNVLYPYTLENLDSGDSASAK